MTRRRQPVGRVAMSQRFTMFRGGELTTERVEGFSDGVLAVALTLLVLELKLPPGLGNEAEIWTAVVHLAPSFAAWLVSFAFVMTIWINHHYFFASVRVADRGLL